MTRLRWATGGESHGPRLTAFVEGIPAGLPLTLDDVNPMLARRQKGYGRGGRMRIETDGVEFVAGVRNAETLGSPIVMSIVNRDYEKWQERMGPGPLAEPGERVIRPRPGHADLAGGLKYDRRDMRDILERASARETASRTAVGAVAKKLLAGLGIELVGYVLSIGSIHARPWEGTYGELRDRVLASDMSCADPESEERMRAHIHEVSHEGDTLGGVVEVIAHGLMPGLGSHTQWDRKLDGRLAQALMSIQAIKGVEIGDGFEAARRQGSKVHDPIAYDGETHRFVRASNGAGGLEGGITNGEPLVVRAAMKPIATLRKALPSVDIDTKADFPAAFERSDICAVAAASVVAEAMVAITLADALLEKFGSDSMTELSRNVEGYRKQMERY